MEYTIKAERGYFNVYINGKFYCTADTWTEAVMEAEDYLYSRALQVAM